MRGTRLVSNSVALLLFSASLKSQAQGTRADYERASHAIAKVLPSALVTDLAIEPNWIGGTSKLWFVSNAGGKKEYRIADAETGVVGPAFDHATLAALLTTMTKTAGLNVAEVHPEALPLENLSFSADTKTLIFSALGRRWKADLNANEEASGHMTLGPAAENEQAGRSDVAATSNTTAAGRGRGRGARGGRGDAGQGNQGGRGRGNARGGTSADGKWRVNVRGSNLVLVSLVDNKETSLTTDGTSDYAYRTPSFSPDSQAITAWRTHPGDHFMMYNVEAKPANGSLRPVLHSVDYTLPGDKVDVSDLYIFALSTADIDSGGNLDILRTPFAPHKVAIDPINYEYNGTVPAIHWLPQGHNFIFREMYRGYARTQLIRVDAATGAPLTIVDNHPKTFVSPLTERIQYLDPTNEIIWTAELDGWNHIYLLDSEKGGVKKQVTKGEWVVKDIINVDRDKRQIVFTGTGREAGEDPYYVHYYRVNFDGSGLILLDPGNGTHTAPLYSGDGKYFVDSYSRVDMPPVTALYRTSDGKLVAELAKADAAPLIATKNWIMPEAFSAKGRDGKTDIYGVIWRPENLNPNKKYPVIEDIYSGPHDFFTPKAFVTTMRFQALADLGFVVVKLDGMGTAGRSKEFQDACWRNLGDSGFPDRIAWIKAAAAKYPYMDTTRVGIYGTSAGGYNAAHALEVHPEFYKVAVSNSGNHDHRTDKIWWNELWMSYPIGPWYSEQSNVDQAEKMRGKLQLVIGGMDTNVNPFAATYQLIEALEKYNKNYDLVVVPESEHGTQGPYRTRRMWDFFVKNLLGVEPPNEFPLDTTGPPTFYRDNTN